jgi:hypothetical protein
MDCANRRDQRATRAGRCDLLETRPQRPQLALAPAVRRTRSCRRGPWVGVGRYSREQDRGHDTYNISQYDLWDTYLAQ